MPNALIRVGMASVVWKSLLFFHRFKILVRPRYHCCSVTQDVTRSDQASALRVGTGWLRPQEQTSSVLVLLPWSSSACGFEAQASFAAGKPNPLATCLFLPQESSPWEGSSGLQASQAASCTPCVWRRGEGPASSG